MKKLFLIAVLMIISIVLPILPVDAKNHKFVQPEKTWLNKNGIIDETDDEPWSPETQMSYMGLREFSELEIRYLNGNGSYASMEQLFDGGYIRGTTTEDAVREIFPGYHISVLKTWTGDAKLQVARINNKGIVEYQIEEWSQPFFKIIITPDNNTDPTFGLTQELDIYKWKYPEKFDPHNIGHLGFPSQIGTTGYEKYWQRVDYSQQEQGLSPDEAKAKNELRVLGYEEVKFADEHNGSYGTVQEMLDEGCYLNGFLTVDSVIKHRISGYQVAVWKVGTKYDTTTDKTINAFKIVIIPDNPDSMHRPLGIDHYQNVYQWTDSHELDPLNMWDLDFRDPGLWTPR
jgi:hypothetical protein